MSQPKIPSFSMPGRSAHQMPTPLANVTLNPEVFEQFIKSQGVRMLHSKPVPCPNVRDLYQQDHNAACNQCFNGFIYYDEREFTGAFFGNTLERMFNNNGTWDLDTANIIVPVRDTSETILDVQYFDQIKIPDVSVRYYQKVEHSQSGLDRLQFPALSVDFVIAAGSRIFRPGIDVIIENGNLRWIGNRPGWQSDIQRGVIYSVNYYTSPVFTIVNLPHQLRIAQTQTAPGQPNVEARFPQLCVCRKDFIPYSRNDKIGEPDRPEPSNGSFV